MSIVYFSAIIVACFIVVKIILQITSSVLTKNLGPFIENDYKQDTFFYTVLFAMIIFVSLVARQCGLLESNNDTFLFIWLAGVLGSVTPVSLSYVILPIYFLIKSRQKHSPAEQSLLDKHKCEHKIIIIDNSETNAFAIGLLPFTKIILLTKNIFQHLSDEGLQAIIAHEAAHLKLNHLRKLYLINIAWMSVVALLYARFIFPLMSTPHFIYYLAAFSAVFYGGGYVVILGYFQKKYEKQADAHAAKKIGKIAVINALRDLNNASQGRMEKWSFNYPTLNQRISHVQSLPD